ncbi:hypothetical protein G6F24_013390 [Rhizopus arrhizus]|nr:hypothetical protein G6F24_013390 [Rhizopus arrhizus]
MVAAAPRSRRGIRMPAGPMFVRGWAALTALVAATSLLLQYLLLLGGPGGEAGVVAATLRFFGYFTILSNLGVCLGCAWLARGRPLGATVAAAMALCIGVTCLVYGAALRRATVVPGRLAAAAAARRPALACIGGGAVAAAGLSRLGDDPGLAAGTGAVPVP